MNIIVILGKRLNNDGSMTNELIKRLDLGLNLLNEDIDYIAVCGGIANKIAGVAEATLMSKYLLDKGIDESKIIIENKSKTTLSNATRLKKILKGKSIDNLYLVSTKYHFERKTYNCFKIFKFFFKNVNIIKEMSE